MKLETNTRLLHHNMAIMGGFLAGYTLLNRIHFLGTAQTNNMIHLVFDLCGRNFFEVLLRLGGFLCYVLGTVTFVLITKKTTWNVKYISLGVNLIAYLIMGLLPEDMQDILRFGVGLQMEQRTFYFRKPIIMMNTKLSIILFVIVNVGKSIIS